MAAKALWQEHEAAGHALSTVRKHEAAGHVVSIVWKHETTGHTVSTVRKQKERKAVLSSLFYSDQDSNP